MLNSVADYKPIGKISLYENDEISNSAIEHMREAWSERQQIVFEKVNGNLIYVSGIESKVDSFPGELFVETDNEGLPETLIGTVENLVELMRKHYADWFSVYEI